MNAHAPQFDPSFEANPAEAVGASNLTADTWLALAMPKRMVVQRGVDANGAAVLHLYYGDQEISFDEPHLFGFGETLARQTRFRAGDALGWAEGRGWDEIGALLQQLVDAEILATEVAADAAMAIDRACPSPLAPAASASPRDWTDCEAITAELTGVPVELGHLELIVPVFRLAHPALDSDGRQVGEANVFPRALRLDVPTEWMACIYPGTRYLVDRPMNVTALKGMRAHWPQMMAALMRIRAGFLDRFPDAEGGWTVGRLERLATLVLAVPTYQLMRADRPVASGDLHPALSSLFRVTDGLRMTMHQMLFVPIGEPTLAADTAMTATEILDYAERNYSFHSETGVCAGPKTMVREFLSVLVDGEGAERFGAVELEPAVALALDDMSAAFDYGLEALRAHAAIFTLWPVMSRSYERLAAIATDAVDQGFDGVRDFHGRIAGRVAAMKSATFLATEAWRVDREAVYADMFFACGRGLGLDDGAATLTDLITPGYDPADDAVEAEIAAILADRFGSAAPAARLAAAILDFARREQAILAAGSDCQARVNRLLGRAQPRRPFGAAEVNVHNRLVGATQQRLPYLIDELDAALGLRLEIDPAHIRVSDSRGPAAAAV